MKKLIVMIGLMVISSVTIAQVNFGPKIGVNSSKISFKDNVNNVEEGDATFGFHAGVFGRIELGSFYLQPELLYTSASGEIKFNDDQLNQVRSYEFNRIDVPIQVGYKFGEVFRIGVAPVYSVLLSDSEQGDAGSQLKLKNSTIGYQAGIGFDIANVILDFRYEGSLSGVGDTFLGADTDQRLNQWTFGIGLKVF